jgi:flagellar biosynthesis chaperone FliJ
MILLSAAIKGIGPFRGEVRLEGLSRGLNVLAAPNETGKSTLFGALHHGFFTPFKTKDQTLKDLVPWATDLGPSVEVEFEHGKLRYRLRKTFLRGPSCQLAEWVETRYEPKFEDEQADEFVRNLLMGAKPEKGAADGRHSGLARLLWVPQGKGALDAPVAHSAVAGRIQAALGSVVADPVEERLHLELDRRYAQTYTAGKGVESKGSELAQARRRLEEQDSQLGVLVRDFEEARQLGLELAACQERLRAADSAFQTCRAEIGSLEREAEALRGVKAQLQAARAEAEMVATRVSALQGDFDGYQARARQLGGLATQIPQVRDDVNGAQLLETKLTADVAAAQDESTRLQASLEAARQQWERTQKQRQTLRDLADRASLADLATKLEAASRAFDDAQARLAGFPEVPASDRQAAEAHDARLRELRAQIRAAGTTVTLALEPARTVQYSGSGGDGSAAVAPGTPLELFTLDRLEVAIEGVGRIQVVSGAGSARELSEQAQRAEEQLAGILAKYSAKSVAELLGQAEHRKALASEADACRTTLEALQATGKFRTAADARSAAGELDAKVAGALAELGQSEEALRLSSLPDDGQLKEAGLAARKQVDDATSALDVLRKRLADAQVRASSGAQTLTALETEKRAAREGADEILKKHEGGLPALEAALGDARSQAAAASDLVQRLAAQVPPPERDPDALLSDRRKAAALLEAQAGEARSAADRLSGKLESFSGRGLYERIAELEEAREQCAAEVARLDLRGRAVKLLLDLAQDRRRRQASGVVQPLAERTTQLWEAVTAVPRREVVFGDDLALRGVRVAGDERGIEPFSGGAREQLFLVARLALAEVLARDDRQFLVVDDSLVYSDPARRDRLLDALGQAAETVQIVILTCDGDRYRGLPAAQHLELQVPVGI